MFAPRIAPALTLALATALGASFAADSPATKAAGQPDTDSSRQARKDLGEKGYTDLMQAFHAARYAVSEESKVVELGGKKGLVAYSRKQNLRAIFSKDGVHVQAPGTETSRPTVHLTPLALHRGEESQPLPTAAPKAMGNRVEYTRGPVTEWYVNEERGLEQGFTVASRFGASDSSDPSAPSDTHRRKELALTLAVSGELRPEAQGDGQSVVFRDPKSSATLLYIGLKAWDATGRVLPSRMTLTEPGSETPPLLQHSNTPAPRKAITPELQLNVDDRNAVYPLTIDPLFTSLGQQLTADDAATGDQFGTSVAVSGDTAVIGASFDDSEMGSAYVFTREGSVWTQQAKLLASGGAAFDGFGSSVAVNGDTVLVGAAGNNVGANVDQGSAYVFARSGGSWSQQAELLAPDGAASDYFGVSVVLSGDTAVVGASGANTSQGFASVFVRSGGTWSLQQRLEAGDGAAGDNFGQSIAVSGETAVVGAPSDDGPAGQDQGSAYVFARSGGTWSQQQQLTAAGAVQYDYFGKSVALSGDTVVVGAPGDDGTDGFDQGTAFVFVRSGATWNQQAQLLAADGRAGDSFGYSVGLSGDNAVVGAYADTVGANSNQGSAYVFVRGGGVWKQQAQLQEANGSGSDFFGASVAVSGNTAVISVNGDDTNAADAGSVQVFDLVTGQAQLLADDGGSFDQFGFSVAVSEDTAVVGAPYDDGNRGNAYVFARSGGVWRQQQRLTHSGQVNDYFGYSVAVSGDTAAVGAWGDNGGAGTVSMYFNFGYAWSRTQSPIGVAEGGYFGSSVALSGNTMVVGAPSTEVDVNQDQGLAWVYVRSGGGPSLWTQQAKIFASDAAEFDEFGISVAVSGDTVVVGAYADDVGANSSQGSAYVFTRSGGAWSQQAQLLADDGGSFDQFGFSVAVSGDTAVVGAYLDDVGGNVGQGSAYVFVRSGGVWSQQAQLLAADGEGLDLFGHAVAVSGDTAVVGTPLDDVGANFDQGSAYVFTRSGASWSQHTQLLAADGAYGDRFGWSVAVSGDTAVVGAYLDVVGANVNQGSAYTYELTPYAPEQVAARVVSSRRIDLSWSDSSGLEDGFEVQFNTAAGRGNTLRYPEVNRIAAAIDGLLPATEYAFRVRAYNNAQDGAWSDWVVATTLAVDPNPMPAAPSGLYATANAANELLLRWTDNANNEDGFILQRSTDRSTWTQITDGTSNTVQFTDTGLPAGATRYYRVRAYNGNGTSAWSEVATGKTWRPVPPTPVQLRALLNPNGGIVVVWKDGANENLYRVEAKLDSGSFSEIGQTGTDVTTFVHAGLSPSQTWTYRVRAANEAGNSGYSVETVISTNPPVPAVPSNLQAVALSNRVVSVTWTDNSTNETEFRLERKTATSAFAQIAVIAANGTTFFDSAVAPSTTYTYRMRAINAGGASGYSTQASGATPASVTEGVLRVRPTAIRFGSVAPGESVEAKLTVSNAGKGKLRVVVGQLSAPFEVLGNRTFTLKAKEQRALKVRYTATETSKGTATSLGVAGSGRKYPLVEVPVTAE